MPLRSSAPARSPGAIALAGSLAIAAAASAQPQTMRIPLAADATVDQQNPTARAPLSPNLDFGKHYRRVNNRLVIWFKRAYVRVDLRPIRSLPRPLRATLFWYQERSRTVPAGCLPVSLHRVTAAWTESTVDWNNKPPHDAARLSTASVGGWNCSGWKSFDVTAPVTGWLDARFPDHGLVIRDPTESRAGAARPGMGHSRESANAARRPYVEVRWDRQYGTGCRVSTPPALALTAGAPRLGQSFTLAASRLAVSSPAVLLLGTSRTTWLGRSLPLNLAAVGSPACSVLAAGHVQLPGRTDVRGATSWRMAVQNNLFLSGKDFYTQAVSLDTRLMFATTNGVALRIH